MPKSKENALDVNLRDVADSFGDEFIIIATSVTLSQALTLAEQVRSAINTPPVPLKDTSLPVTASLGVCQSKPDDSIASIIQRVDRAMFSAKKAGGNRVMSSQKHLSTDHMK